MSHYNIFHEAEASLAEGIYVDEFGKRVFWVDIERSEIHSKSFDGRSYHQYATEYYPSALFGLKGSKLFLSDSRGVAVFDIDTAETKLVSRNPDTGFDSDFRSNDGTALPDESVVYGTMEMRPSGITGGVYFFDGTATYTLDCPIGIPNGFIWLSDTDILIADSYTRHVYLYKFDRGNAMLRRDRCWHDFSEDGFTPDGGCADSSDTVYFALWDGSGVGVLNFAGDFLGVIDLPALRPTNCKMGGSRSLFVTTAREGMTDAQLDKYPLSGSVFEIELG